MPAKCRLFLLKKCTLYVFCEIMKRIIGVLMILFCIAVNAQTKKFALVIHGGAGSVARGSISAEKEKAYTMSLQKALKTGNDILAKGGTALDAVEAAIACMEDDSLFNAGKGAVFTNEGRNELDASIMDGNTLKAGAVASVTTIKNPIKAARTVMDKTNHVMLVSTGAEKFAKEAGLEIVKPSYFRTEGAWKTLLRTKAEDSLKDIQKKKSLLMQSENRDSKYGTVGAAALDIYGNLAAGTSTGGMTNKKFGRVGDSPIIGAGTYANNSTCAISCTGWGEYFIRLSMAKSVSDRMELKGMSLDAAAEEMIMRKLPELGGDGGLIGLDKEGNITMHFNTPGMFRGYIKSTGEQEVLMYKD
jgi:beta-aspartyl-peptidase (threonine type)